MVANAMIATAAEHFHDSVSLTVYHVASSYRNPTMYKQITEISIRYFKMRYAYSPKTSSTFVHNGYILELLSITFPSQFGDKYQHHNRKFKMAMRQVEIYEPYLLFKGIFEDRNLETLRIKNEAKEMNDLPRFSSKCIDWEDYFTNTHIPGLVTHYTTKNIKMTYINSMVDLKAFKTIWKIKCMMLVATLRRLYCRPNLHGSLKRHDNYEISILILLSVACSIPTPVSYGGFSWLGSAVNTEPAYRGGLVRWFIQERFNRS
ncbi:hypothetical protein YC2023_119044 [Brassica napus]